MARSPTVSGDATPTTGRAADRRDPSAAPVSPADAFDRQSLLALVREDLARFFDYPRFAQRRGWEGEVLLAFRVTGSGAITAVRVSRSSGYPLLDQAAVTSLQQVRHLHTAPLQATDLELPVVYRLEG